MNPLQCASKTSFSAKASQFASQHQTSVQRRQLRGIDVCHQICVAMAQTNGGQPQVTNNFTFAITWVHTIRTSVFYVDKAAVVFTHCLCGMLAQHKQQCTLSALLYILLVKHMHSLHAGCCPTNPRSPAHRSQCRICTSLDSSLAIKGSSATHSLQCQP